MLGVVLDADSLDRGDLDWSALQKTLPRWRQHAATDPLELPERLAGAGVVVTNKVVLDAARLAESGLKLVCVAATGINNVDLAAARSLGIAVANVQAYATASVTQHVFSLILALTTRLPDYQAAVQQQRWQHSGQFCLLDWPIRELAGRTLGIVGYGELGRGVARLAEAFGMHVLVSARPGAGYVAEGRVAWPELLSRVDVLSLHCPLTRTTRGLIGARELARMRSDALLINTARGGIVDEPALAEALRSGRLGGAGVDVLSVEPPAQGNALLDAEIPNLIVTPHIAWASREARQRLLDEVTANIRAWRDGERRNRLD